MPEVETRQYIVLQGPPDPEADPDGTRYLRIGRVVAESPEDAIRALVKPENLLGDPTSYPATTFVAIAERSWNERPVWPQMVLLVGDEALRARSRVEEQNVRALGGPMRGEPSAGL